MRLVLCRCRFVTSASTTFTTSHIRVLQILLLMHVYECQYQCIADGTYSVAVNTIYCTQLVDYTWRQTIQIGNSIEKLNVKQLTSTYSDSVFYFSFFWIILSFFTAKSCVRSIYLISSRIFFLFSATLGQSMEKSQSLCVEHLERYRHYYSLSIRCGKYNNELYFFCKNVLIFTQAHRSKQHWWKANLMKLILLNCKTERKKWRIQVTKIDKHTRKKTSEANIGMPPPHGLDKICKIFSSSGSKRLRVDLRMFLGHPSRRSTFSI